MTIAETEYEAEKLYKEAEELKRREQNNIDLKRAWKKFIKKGEKGNDKRR